MKIASVADVKAKFSAHIKASSRSPVVVTRNGKAVAAIIPLPDEDAVEQLMLSYSPRLRAILSAARRRVAGGAAIPHERFWREASPPARKPRRRPA